MLYINHNEEVYNANILPETEARGILWLDIHRAKGGRDILVLVLQPLKLTNIARTIHVIDKYCICEVLMPQQL